MLIARTIVLGVALCLALISDSNQAQLLSQQVPAKQPEATVSQQKSPDEQKGTEQSPLIVKVAPTPKTDEERAEETKVRERMAESDTKKEKSDADLVKYTAELALFTKGLFAATVALVIATVGLGVAAFIRSRDMKASIRAAQTAAIAAERQSVTMRQMADIADKQLSITGLQTDIQQKQHAVARLQFLATHRPRLRIRHVSISDPAFFIGHPTMFFNHGGEIKGGLVVVNVGGTKATIIESRYRIFFSKDGLPVTAPYESDFHNLLLAGQSLDIGESCATPIMDKIIMDPPAPGREDEVELPAFERGGWKIYVMGQIRYKDEGGAHRFMGFCRLQESDGRFRAIDDPDYEYDD
jgi:hypothetical protein